MKPIAREVIAVYDGSREVGPRDTRIHRHAEMVLNHLGYTLRYLDAREELPDLSAMQNVAGIVSWLSAPLPASARQPYLAWAVAAMRNTRFVVLDETGGDAWGGELDAVNRVLAGLGLVHTGRGVTVTAGTKPRVLKEGVFGYERQMFAVPPAYAVYRQARSDVDVLLEVQSPAREDSRTSVLAVTGPSGGFVAPGFSLAFEPTSGQVAWLLDPFKFFRAALGTPGWPVPDVQTLSGRRIYFSHVDGLGLHNVLKARRDRLGRLYAEIFLDEIVRAYPDLPLTFGVIAGDIDRESIGNEAIRAMARNILAAPHVEIGVHTYSHPHVWPATLPRHSVEAAETSTTASRASAWLPLAGQSAYGDASAKRMHAKRAISVATEVDFAIGLVDGLAPDGKYARLYQWSGDNRPSEAMIAAVKAIGLANINGGDGRFDFDYPSIAYLAPLGLRAAHALQVYATSSGGSTTTSYWRPHATGILMLGQAMERTASPRLKPIGLHYSLTHIGDGQFRQFVKGYLDKVRIDAVVPVEASAYARMVEGFYSLQLLASPDRRRWTVEARGEVQSLRLDDPALTIDLGASTGVVGMRRDAGAEYIALDPAVATPVVILRDAAGPAPADVAAALVESRWRVERLERKPCELRFAARGHGDGDFVWAGLSAPRTYGIVAERGGAVAWRGTAVAAQDGTLRFKIPAMPSTVKVTVQCTDGASHG